MLEVIGNIWDYHREGEWIGITTNGVIAPETGLVMGRGLALQAKKRYPSLPHILAELVKDYGNKPFALSAYRICSFPTKDHWQDPSPPALIARSARWIMKDYINGKVIDRLYLPKPGCANGGLEWSVVKAILEPIFTDDRIVICDLQ